MPLNSVADKFWRITLAPTGTSSFSEAPTLTMVIFPLPLLFDLFKEEDEEKEVDESAVVALKDELKLNMLMCVCVYIYIYIVCTRVHHSRATKSDVEEEKGGKNID